MFTIVYRNKPKSFATALDAIRALIGELPNEDLNGLRFLNMVRAETLHRKGYEIDESAVGTKASVRQRLTPSLNG